MPIIVAACLASVIIITIVLITYASGIKKDFSTKVRGVVDQVNTSQFYQYELEKRSLDKLNSLVNNVDNIRNNYVTKKEFSERMVTNVLDVKDIKQHDGTVNIQGNIDFGNSVGVNRTSNSVDINVRNGSTFNIKDTAEKKLLTVTDKIEIPYAKIDKIQLGDKFQLSGVGDAHGNDGWLRLFNKSGNGYKGGMAMDSLWIESGSFLNGKTQVSMLDVKGNSQFKGGIGEYNLQRLPTQFPANNDKNYLRGDTDLVGNNRNIGDLSIGRDLNVNKDVTLKGKLCFDDVCLTKDDIAKVKAMR